MREVTEKFNVYTFESAPKELKEKIIENIRYNWDIYEFNMQERIKTLKEVANILDANLHYSLSCVPDRGEFIKMTPKYEELDFSALWEVMNQEKDCPFTGCYYDHDIIDRFTKYNLNTETLNDILNDYITEIHKEYESMFTEEYISDMCEANEYEFTIDGKLY